MLTKKYLMQEILYLEQRVDALEWELNDMKRKKKTSKK